MTDFLSKFHGKATSALERGFFSVASPFQAFIRKQKTTSTRLLVPALITLIITNSPFADASYVLMCGSCCSTNNDPEVNMTMYRG